MFGQWNLAALATASAPSAMMNLKVSAGLTDSQAVNMNLNSSAVSFVDIARIVGWKRLFLSV
jgi:hypothetical protein